MIDLQERNFLVSSTGDSVSVEMILTNMEGNLPQTVKNHVLAMQLKAVVEHGETVSTQLATKVCRTPLCLNSRFVYTICCFLMRDADTNVI